MDTHPCVWPTSRTAWDPQDTKPRVESGSGAGWRQLSQGQNSAGHLRQHTFQHVQPVSGGFSGWVVPARLSIPFAHSRDVVRDAQGRDALDQLPPGLMLLQKALLFQERTGSCVERASPCHVLTQGITNCSPGRSQQCQGTKLTWKHQV